MIFHRLDGYKVESTTIADLHLNHIIYYCSILYSQLITFTQRDVFKMFLTLAYM
jgi:hypothetical protein